jgi:hypothetical protein
MWDVVVAVAAVASVVVALLAHCVAVKALNQDRATAGETRRLAAEANDVQARLLAIDEARRLEEMAPSVELGRAGCPLAARAGQQVEGPNSSMQNTTVGSPSPAVVLASAMS